MGAFKDLAASDIGSQVIKQILIEKKIPNDVIDGVIVGQVLTAGAGQNPARQTSLGAGISQKTPAFLINQVCGSGLKSVIQGYLSIFSGNSSLVLAGGQENMSMCPHAVKLRQLKKMGNLQLIDLMIHDGLTDVFNNFHMGVTAENLAEKYNISREAQDNFALESCMRAQKAKAKFAGEIIPIILPDGSVIKEDESIRDEYSLERLKDLKSVFKKDGTVTAGNSSSINDGAAFVLLADTDAVIKNKLQPIARIISYGESGVDPALMGLGPVEAISKALDRAHWQKDEVDIFEINEAFAAQTLAVLQALGLKQKINVCGGAIALGHPIGASGTRCLVTLLHIMRRRNFQKGVVSLCIGGGMGIAMCVEFC